MDQKKTEQMLLKVADYESNEQQRFSRRICGLFIAAILAFILYSVLNFTGLDTQNGYEQIASYAMGIVGGALLVGALYTSGYLAKIKALKKRLLHKTGKSSEDAENGRGENGNRVICTVLVVYFLISAIKFNLQREGNTVRIYRFE